MDLRRYSFFLWAPFIIGNVAETLTRTKFEEFNMDLFRSNMKPVQMVMEEGDMQKRDVDEIALDGKIQCFHVSIAMFLFHKKGTNY